MSHSNVLPAHPLESKPAALDILAGRVGIEPAFRNAQGETITAGAETKRRLLGAMGFAASDDAAIARSLAELDRAENSRTLPPVVVARAGPVSVELALASGSSSIGWRLILEDKVVRTGQAQVAALACAARFTRDNEARDRRILVLDDVPEGYHRLQVENDEASIIATPARCWLPDADRRGGRLWGVAVQLYLLRSAGNWGIGDYSDLTHLVGLMASRGADVIGLNPLHAMFLDRPEHASPYSPASRLLLNVLNIDVMAVPALTGCKAAQAIISGGQFQAQLSACRDAERVDYARVAALKLEVLSAIFASCPGVRSSAFEAFRKNRGDTLQVGCVFQALREHLAIGDPLLGDPLLGDPLLGDWRNWPEEYRNPGSEAVARFAATHSDRVTFRAWLQFVAETQLSAAAEAAHNAGMAIGLYRDLAVGADPSGTEAWVNQGTMSQGAAVGAPPDILNPAGQNWGLPPFNPFALRQEAYASFIELIRANMRHAGGIRIDHVMALQRLYWIPTGCKPAEGAYVRYDVDALIGILALESQRNRCMVVGEDLGTVPAGFRERLAAAGILSYRVLFFEQDEAGHFIPPEDYPRLALSVAGSHDLPTLRGWWLGADIPLKQRLGLYPQTNEAARQTALRASDRAALTRAFREAGLVTSAESMTLDQLVEAVHAFLARTPSIVAMVQIDDITGETDPVNVPASSDEHPNWRRRQSVALEELAAVPLLDTISALFNAAREGNTGGGERSRPDR